MKTSSRLPQIPPTRTPILRTLASALLISAIAACPVLCGTCWEILGLKHGDVFGQNDGDHSPLTPANDGDDCICKCKGAVAIGSGDGNPAAFGKLKPILSVDLFAGLGLLGEFATMPAGAPANPGRYASPLARAPLRAILQNFRC